MASTYTKSPPPTPADAEVVRNIEVLAAFVAKTGAQFEQLARTKTGKDPKFEFLLDGNPPGSEAARAHAFYQWKKQRIEQRVFASDGSDDLQLKICAMVDEDFKCPLPSDAHGVDDDAKPLLAGAVENTKMEENGGRVRKAEASQIDDSVKNRAHPPAHQRTKVVCDVQSTGDVRPPPSEAEKKPETIASIRGKNGAPQGKLPQPLHEAIGATDQLKPPLSTAENKKTAVPTLEAPPEDLISRLSQPVQGAKDGTPNQAARDSQRKTSNKSEDAQKVGSSRDGSKNNPSGPSGGARPAGDAGVHQQGAEGPEKHAKENHGLKLLKAALADHVKEVLNPAWKEGILNKEAFKSIVKKVVDKVVGSLQAHQIPKSQENVDQYMALSQTKITKLVQVGQGPIIFSGLVKGGLFVCHCNGSFSLMQGYVDKFKKN